MPVQYTDIVDEHLAVRNDCGVFDVSHMGEVLVSGPEAERFVQHIFTNDVSVLATGNTMYGMMLHENGGTIDDIMVYKEADDRFLFRFRQFSVLRDAVPFLHASAAAAGRGVHGFEYRMTAHRRLLSVICRLRRRELDLDKVPGVTLYRLLAFFLKIGKVLPAQMKACPEL